MYPEGDFDPAGFSVGRWNGGDCLAGVKKGMSVGVMSNGAFEWIFAGARHC
jgi:hypothetical protein